MPEHNVVPKTPEMIIKEFWQTDFTLEHETEEGGLTQSISLFKIEDHLRSAMRSLLQQAIEEMPKQTGEWDCGCHTKGYDDGIEDCTLAIKSLQERI